MRNSLPQRDRWEAGFLLENWMALWALGRLTFFTSRQGQRCGLKIKRRNYANCQLLSVPSEDYGFCQACVFRVRITGFPRGKIQQRVDSATPVVAFKSATAIVTPLMTYNRLDFSYISGNQMSQNSRAIESRPRTAVKTIPVRLLQRFHWHDAYRMMQTLDLQVKGPGGIQQQQH